MFGIIGWAAMVLFYWYNFFDTYIFLCFKYEAIESKARFQSMIQNPIIHYLRYGKTVIMMTITIFSYKIWSKLLFYPVTIFCSLLLFILLFVFFFQLPRMCFFLLTKIWLFVNVYLTSHLFIIVNFVIIIVEVWTMQLLDGMF